MLSTWLTWHYLHDKYKFLFYYIFAKVQLKFLYFVIPIP